MRRTHSHIGLRKTYMLDRQITPTRVAAYDPADMRELDYLIATGSTVPRAELGADKSVKPGDVLRRLARRG